MTNDNHQLKIANHKSSSHKSRITNSPNHKSQIANHKSAMKDEKAGRAPFGPRPVSEQALHVANTIAPAAPSRAGQPTRSALVSLIRARPSVAISDECIRSPNYPITRSSDHRISRFLWLRMRFSPHLRASVVDFRLYLGLPHPSIPRSKRLSSCHPTRCSCGTAALGCSLPFPLLSADR